MSMYRLLKRILDPISDMRMRDKLLLSYFVLIIIPFAIFVLVSTGRVSHNSELQVKYSSKQSFKQTGDLISNKIKKIIDTTNVILVDKNINNILKKNPGSLDISEQLKDVQTLTNLIRPFQNNDEIYNVKLYINDNFLYSHENENFLSLNDVKGTSWYNSFVSNNFKLIWLDTLQNYTPAEENYSSDTFSGRRISAVRAILDSDDYFHIIGLLRIDILQSTLNDILKKTSSTQNTITYIINSKNEIISSSSNKIKASWKLNYNKLINLTSAGGYFDAYSLKKEKILLASQKLTNSDWIMVSVTPYNEIFAAAREIRNEMLALFLVIGTAAYGLAYIISLSITKRINLLANRMRKIQTGDFDAKIHSRSKDEIGELIHDFNYMTDKLSYLIEEQFRIGQEAKNAELMALQSQINPHFLYNTLDLINWTAINNNVPEISETVQALSRFYKLSLSKGKNVIPIADEIEHAKLYLEIQNRKFQNAFTLETEIDEAALNYSTLKIILQPIFENAVLHGILQKQEKHGLIRLTVKKLEDVIIFEVTDDGEGISQDKLENLLSSEVADSHGYGIKNINKRIKVYYGEEYGLSFTSIEHKGTTVTVRIPCIKKEHHITVSSSLAIFP